MNSHKDNGSGALEINSADGNQKVLISSSPSGGSIYTYSSDPKISLIALSPNPQNSSGYLQVNSADGKPQVAISSFSGIGGFLETYNSDKKALLRLTSDSQGGSGYIQVNSSKANSQQEQGQAAIFANGNGGRIEIKDLQGKVKVVIGIDDNGNGSIWVTQFGRPLQRIDPARIQSQLSPDRGDASDDDEF